MFAGQFNPVMLEHRHDRPRRAGRPGAFACRHQTDVERMHRIHVLFRVKAARDDVRIDLRRQRHHRQNAADFRIGVQLSDLRQQFVLCRFCRQCGQMVADAEAAAQFAQPVRIDNRRMIVANQNYRQSADNALVTQFTGFFRQAGPNRSRRRFSLHNQSHLYIILPKITRISGLHYQCRFFRRPAVSAVPAWS